MQSKIWLSKSTYLRSLQCLKSLYLYKNYYQLRDKPSKETLQLFSEGHQVEEEARKLLFGKGINVKPQSPRSWSKAIQTTKLLIENGEPLIFEAAFNFQGVMCAVDVVKIENNKLQCFEIKRGSSIKDVYLKDCSLQYWVIQNLNYSILNFSLINFIGDRDQSTFSASDFKITSVVESIKKQQEKVTQDVAKAKETLAGQSIPNIAMGNHCYQPYNCDFIGYCSQEKEMNKI